MRVKMERVLNPFAAPNARARARESPLLPGCLKAARAWKTWQVLKTRVREILA